MAQTSHICGPHPSPDCPVLSQNVCRSLTPQSCALPGEGPLQPSTLQWALAMLGTVYIGTLQYKSYSPCVATEHWKCGHAPDGLNFWFGLILIECK